MFTQLVVCYNYFKDFYKLIARALSKQQTLDADPKVTQQINLTGNLDWAGQTNETILDEAKKNILDFSQGTVIVL